MRSKQEVMQHAEQVAGTQHPAAMELQLIILEVLLDIRNALLPATETPTRAQELRGEHE